MATKMTSSNHHEIFKKAIVKFGSPIKETMRLTAPDFNLKLLKVADDVKDVAMAYALELNLFDIAFKISFMNECDTVDIAGAPKDRNELQETIVELIDTCKPTSGDLKGIEFHVPLFYSFDLETASSSYFDDELRAKAHKIWITHLGSIGIAELEVLQCYKENRSKYAALQPLKYQLEKIEVEIAKDNSKDNAIKVEASEVRYPKQSNLNPIATGEVIDTTPKYFKTYRSLVGTVASLLSLGSTLSLLAGGIWLAMEIGMPLEVQYTSLVLVSLIATFQNHYTAVCLAYGRFLADADFLKGNPRGYQDAITNPKGNLWFFLIQALRLSIIILIIYFGGWWHVLGTLIVVFFVAYLMNKLVLPAPNSLFWAKGIFTSLIRREADFKRDGDEIRYEAMKEIKEIFLLKIGDRIDEDRKSTLDGN